MHIVLVYVTVRTDFLDAFIDETKINASNSRMEPGVVRFDFLQEKDDHTKFTLVEVYKTPEDQLLHRETAHYKVWRDAVESMMQEPRVGVKYSNIDPQDTNW